MIITANRLRSIGWLALLGIFGATVLILAFRVNALKSEVRKSENRIVALKQEKMYLETEFETRANQQQLEAWNDLDFGYVAPSAGQYLEGERQLAALGKPAGPDAPAPIRVASVDDTGSAKAAFPAVASPLDGKPVGLARRIDTAVDVQDNGHSLDRPTGSTSLGKRLTLLVADDSQRPAKVRTQAVDKSAEKLANRRDDAKDGRTERAAERRVSGKTEGAAQAQRR